jgi:hypothetical protein
LQGKKHPVLLTHRHLLLRNRHLVLRHGHVVVGHGDVVLRQHGIERAVFSCG